MFLWWNHWASLNSKLQVNKAPVMDFILTSAEDLGAGVHFKNLNGVFSRNSQLCYWIWAVTANLRWAFILSLPKSQKEASPKKQASLATTQCQHKPDPIKKRARSGFSTCTQSKGTEVGGVGGSSSSMHCFHLKAILHSYRPPTHLPVVSRFVVMADK